MGIFHWFNWGIRWYNVVISHLASGMTSQHFDMKNNELPHFRWETFNFRWSMDWFWGKIYRKTWFSPSTIGVSCQYSHHPILWDRQITANSWSFIKHHSDLCRSTTFWFLRRTSSKKNIPNLRNPAKRKTRLTWPNSLAG